MPRCPPHVAQTQHPPSELPEKMKDPFVNQTPGPKNEAGTRVLDSQLFRKYPSVHTPEDVSAISSEHAAWLGLEGVMLMKAAPHWMFLGMTFQGGEICGCRGSIRMGRRGWVVHKGEFSLLVACSLSCLWWWLHEPAMWQHRIEPHRDELV